MADLDAFDLRLLALLQDDARLTHSDMADAIGLSASQISRRIQRLVQSGVILRQVAILNREKLALGVTAFVTAVMRSHGEADIATFRERLRRLPEVQECYKITGEADYLVRITTGTLESYNRILTEYLLKVPEVAAVRSSLVLEETKHTTALPLPFAR